MTNLYMINMLSKKYFYTQNNDNYVKYTQFRKHKRDYTKLEMVIMWG